MALTLNQLLGGVPMTAAAQGIRRGIPNNIPPSFFRVTKRLVGNVFQWKRVDGNRNLARLVQYGAPSVLVGKTGIKNQSAAMVHSFEHMTHDPLILQNLQSADGSIQDLATEEVDRGNADFMERFNSLRTAFVGSMLANGKVWANADGLILPSSSGADLTIDPVIPAGNLNQLGGIIDASWATTTTKILLHLQKIKAKAAKESQYPIVHAFYGSNIPGYIARNDEVKGFLTANPAYAQTIYSTGTIPAGFADLQWHPMETQILPDAAGTTMTDQFGADSISFWPEPDASWWEFVEGSYMVPRSIDVAQTAIAALANLVTVYGKFAYAVPTHNPVGITQFAGDTFFAALKVPKAVFIADTTP